MKRPFFLRNCILALSMAGTGTVYAAGGDADIGQVFVNANGDEGIMGGRVRISSGVDMNDDIFSATFTLMGIGPLSGTYNFHGRGYKNRGSFPVNLGNGNIVFIDRAATPPVIKILAVTNFAIQARHDASFTIRP